MADISGLVEGGSYPCEARSWRDATVCARQGAGRSSSLLYPERRRLWFRGELISAWLISYWGNKPLGHVARSSSG